jgi:hypothetical protein
MKYVVQIGIDNPYWLTSDNKLYRNIRKARRFTSYKGACMNVQSLNRLNRLSVIVLPLSEAMRLREMLKIYAKPDRFVVSRELQKVISFNAN